MSRIYAYTDEAGNNSFDFEKDDISTCFIVASVLVAEENLKEVEMQIELIRKKYFQTGEMKSSSVGKNHKRRIAILNRLKDIDFKIFAVVINKKMIDKKGGLQFKSSFYKFTNNLVHKELRAAFRVLTVCADEIGSNDFMRGFCEYVKKQEEYPNLLQECEFSFSNSKRNVLIQLADFISGTLLYTYDENKNVDAPNYIQLLNDKIISIENYPKRIENYVFNGGVLSKEYNEEIANISLKRAQMFLSKYEHDTDPDRVLQVYTLKYLCFRFINNDTRHYITTKEIINYLERCTGEIVNVQHFRSKVIAKLRDNNVIIASSSKGLKLPSQEKELYDFINHGTTIVMPLLARLKKCRDIVNMETLGELDLFNNTEYKSLQKFFNLEYLEELSEKNNE